MQKNPWFLAGAFVVAATACGGGKDGADGTSCSVEDTSDGTKTITCTDGTSAVIANGKAGGDGQNGADGSSCSVEDNGDGTSTISCTDDTSVVVSNGTDGTDGSSCSVEDNGDGTSTISCTDGTFVAISNGADGTDGTDGASCSVEDSGDGTSTISCTDGTSVRVSDGTAGVDGLDGTSCTVADNGDGTSTISCSDGTSVVVSDGIDGVDGTSCTVADNGNGTSTVSCADGSSVVVSDGTDGSSCTVTTNAGTGITTLDCEDGTSAIINDSNLEAVATLLTKTVFVTGATYNGDLLSAAKSSFASCAGVTTGLGGADCICQQTAESAGLGGTYLAWIAEANNASAPGARFTRSTQPYVLTDFTPVAANYDDLVDGTLLTAINTTETGDAAGGTDRVWTNVRTNGNQFNNSTCADWEDTTAGVGVLGLRTQSDSRWTAPGSGVNCVAGNHLYCFEQ